MATARSLNRKLLVSVYTPQEAREAILGGGRIIDSEDPKSALGNISPLKIMAIRDAVLDCARDLEVQLSTNIGEDQLIFRRSATGRALQKSPEEMAGKAAQAALGVAISMGTEVHPCSIVKVGLDAMEADQLGSVLREVVQTLRRTPALKQCPVMSVLFAQDLDLWDARKHDPSVRAELVSLREFAPLGDGNPERAFRLSDYWDKLRDERGRALPERTNEAQDLSVLKRLGILPDDVASDRVVVNELLPHHRFFGGEESRRTTREVIRRMVDITAKSGADAMMLDTSVLSKVSNICLVDTSQDGMADLSPFIVKNGLRQRGILRLAELRFFVEYAHYVGIVPNLAGSIDSIQAQQIWALLPETDQISTRGAASGAVVEPGSGADGSAVDTRRLRTIVRDLTRGLAPPEHGGVLNLPIALRDAAEARASIEPLVRALRGYREANGLPPLQARYVDGAGRVVAPVDTSNLRSPANGGAAHDLASDEERPHA
jgi:uncharacterized protein (UPF0264 family)